MNNILVIRLAKILIKFILALSLDLYPSLSDDGIMFLENANFPHLYPCWHEDGGREHRRPSRPRSEDVFDVPLLHLASLLEFFKFLICVRFYFSNLKQKCDYPLHTSS